MAPDLYMASMARSGSTAIANHFTDPERGQLVLVEPGLLGERLINTLPAQLARAGIALDGVNWPVARRDAGAFWRDHLQAALKSRKWGMKEVKGDLHLAALERTGAHLLFTLRDIRTIHLSLAEKINVQGTQERYPRAWIRDYCVEESDKLMVVLDRAEALGRAHSITRYEDFFSSADERSRIANVTGFAGGGDVGANFDLYDREEERMLFDGRIESARAGGYRTIGAQEISDADETAALCAGYQERFGFR